MPAPAALKGATRRATVSHDEDLKLRFYATRCEPNFAAPFFAQGGQLGSAVARDETFFALSGAKFSTGKMINDKASLIEVDLPASAYSRDINTGVVQISQRARMNISACRVGAAINGTVSQTLSGQGSIPIYELFTEAVKYKDAQTGEDADQVMIMPFQQVPLKYSAWGAHSAVISVCNPQVVALDPLTGVHTAAQDVQFVRSPGIDAFMAKSEPALQSIYDSAWALREHLVYKGSPNLTKSVMRVPGGYNASGYALSASVNDIPVSFSNEALESILSAAVSSQIPPEEHKEMLHALESPSIFATQRHAQTLATAMSVFAAFTCPYRVDGTPVITPDGVNMVQAESWRFEALHGADDCDGSAANNVAVINAAVAAEEATPGQYPHLRALANSIGAHYVFGVSVLGATSGHADAANEHETKRNGHAASIALPKAHFIAAYEKGSRGMINDEPVIASDHEYLADAVYNALYPTSLVMRMPSASVSPMTGQVLNEQKMFSSLQGMKLSGMTKFGEDGLQPLAMEGTTPASSKMYEHDHSLRQERARVFAIDNKLGERFSPNVARMHKVLDSATTGKHAFYSEFVELGVSMKSGLFTSDALRSKSAATAHFAFAKPVAVGNMAVCGATPHELATGDYAVVPLWRVGDEMAKIIDAAHDEAVGDALPRREKPPMMVPQEHERLSASLTHLQNLHAKIKTDTPECERSGNCLQHFFAHDSLVHNPQAIKHFCDVVESQSSHLVGDVIVTPVKDVARDEGGNDVGAFVAVNVWVKD